YNFVSIIFYHDLKQIFISLFPSVIITSIHFILRCWRIFTDMWKAFQDIVLDSLFLIIALLLILCIGLIFFLLGKVPLFRWVGLTIIRTIRYVFITIFNMLAIGLLSGMATIGVIAILVLFHYLDWEFFMVGNEILILHHDVFFGASFLIGLSFVISILVGTFIFSFIPLSTRKYVLASYVTGTIGFILLLPLVLQSFFPDVRTTLLGMTLICAALPILGLIFMIASGQKRKE